MESAAAFQACFSDWKLIKGRKVVQVVLELPIEAADQAYQALGGMPDPGKSVWCAVARLQEQRLEGRSEETGARASDVVGAKSESEARTPPPSKRRFDSLPLPQQAALLCQDPVFWAFLNEKLGWDDIRSEADAAMAIRERCGILSRSELSTHETAAKRFITDREQFQAWRLVGA